MAHEIESMAWAGDVPWHGLGVEVGDDLSPKEMMQAAGLDWTVRTLPAYVDVSKDRNNPNLVPTGQKALVRSTDNRVLTSVSGTWNPVQNEDAFEFFQEFIDSGDMKMHTAGSLKGGEIVWGLAKTNQAFELFGGDVVESYLLFTNPHQYGKTVDIRLTPIRVVCNNTLTLATMGKDIDKAIRVNHRQQFDADKIKELMGYNKFQFDQFRSSADIMGSRRADKDKLVEFFGDIFGTKKGDDKELSRTAKKAMEAMEYQPGADFAAGSWWSAFNAVTYLVDHELGRSNDTRLQSAWYGNNGNLKKKALKMALTNAGS